MSEQKHLNFQLEVRVLSTLYHEKESRQFVAKIVAQAFSDPANRLWFDILKDLSLKNLSFEVDFISSQYRQKIDRFPGAWVRWTELTMAETLDKNSFLWAISELKNLLFLRLSWKIAKRILDSTLRLDRESVLKHAQVISRTHSAIYNEGGYDLRHFESAVKVINSRDEYIKPFSRRLHSLIGGWTRGDVSTIAGKSGHNKTTFTLFDAKESIKESFTRKVLYITADEPGDKIARRVIASELGISMSKMRNKELLMEDREVLNAIERIFLGRLIILDDLYSAESIYEAILDIKPDRTIVDHIQELDFGSEGISDQKVTVSAKKLKEAAKLTNSNVTIISQVRDKVVDERFEDKIPRAHDLLYGSDLRRKSRELVVVYWDYNDTHDREKANVFQVVVYKSTYSSTGRIKLRINPDLASFSEDTGEARSALQALEEL